MKKIKLNILKKILAILVAVFLTVNPLLFPVLAYAEGEEGTGVVENENNEVTPTPTPEITTISDPEITEVMPTPTPESTITTGDATSGAEVDTTTNINQETIPGEITTPAGDCAPPEGETSCPPGTEIQNDNLAQVGDEATSAAQTGENEIIGTEGDATINTGDATAGGQIENEINTNTVLLEPTSSPTPSPTPIPTPALLFISEYVEGSSNNKAIEIYNPVGSPVDLTAGGYKLEFYFNGNSSPGTTINLSGLVNPGDVFVVSHENASSAIKDLADQTSSASFYNGNDAVVLKIGSEILDVLGQIGFDPGTEWGSGDTSTADNTLVRKCLVSQGDTDGSDAFDPSLEWDGYPTDTFGYLGSHSLCSPTPTPTPTSVPGEEESLTVINNNEATVTNQGDVSASTGENQASQNAGNAEIETGDALAYGNIFNLVNTNIVGTNIVILVLNLFDQVGDIDLNTIWKELLEQEEEGIISPLPESSYDFEILIYNQNQADLGNNLVVEATSGQNQASGNGGWSKIKTGKATALANVVNLVNTNLVGSTLFFGIINIFNSFQGNLLLPRPERFITNIPYSETDAEGGAQVGSLENSREGSFASQNEAEVEGNVSASASTGENQALGNPSGSSITTGNAKSAAQSMTVANLNVQRNNWFFLALNNLGSWLGFVLGWSSPETQETADSQMNTYATGLNAGDNGQESGGVQAGAEDMGDSLFPLIVVNENKVKVKSNVSARASSGQNVANGNGSAMIETGAATALANLLNLVNLNILGGRWFMAFVNMMGDWQGDAIFTHPDVTIEINDGQDKASPGDFIEYKVNFQNQGYDEAQGVLVKLDLPVGASYISDTSGTVTQISGQSYTWTVGNVPAGMGGTFKVRVEIDENYSEPQEVSFWSKVIPKAYAAEEEFKGNLVVSASIVTLDPESDTDNNSSSDINEVFATKNSGGDNLDDPKLEITAWNNVGEFVYPGDTVTFELIIKNSGSGPAKNSVVTQNMFDGDPGSLGEVKFDVGTIEPQKRVKISFGLALVEDLPPALYTTVAKATGESPKGEKVTSNVAETRFNLIAKGSLIPQVLAAESQGESGESQKEGQPLCPPVKQEKDWLPYFLAALLGTLWLIDWLRRKGQSGELTAALAVLKKKVGR